MKYRFGWKSKRRNQCQHIIDADDKSLCQVENGGTVLDTFADSPIRERRLCGICQHLMPERVVHKPKKKRRAQKRPPTNRNADPFIRSWEWRQVRYKALLASDGKCCCCGVGPEQGAILNVDHIKSRRQRPDLALSLSNLQVLCGSCNHGKGNRDDTDWREPSLRVLMGEEMA